MKRLADVRHVVVPRRAVDVLHAHLRGVGQAGHEGLGLWVGTQDGPRFTVTQTLVPAQRHVQTADGVCVIIEAGELHRVNVWLYRNGLTLLGQVHSHPGRAYHSSTDDEHAIAAAEGAISLVVPDFARREFLLPALAGYRLDAAGRWRPMGRADLNDLIELED